NWSLTSHGLVRAILVSPLLGGFVFLSLFLILSSPSTFSDKFYVVEGIYFEKGQDKQAALSGFSDTAFRTENNFIDFRSGLPALDLFPRKQWSQFARHVYATAEPALFGYDNPEGRPELRTALASYLQRTRGVMCQPEHILILSGASQAFSLLNRLLLSANDDIVIEDPVNYEIQLILSSSGARLCPIPVDEYGMQTDLLPRNKQPRCIFVTPSHQFPQGGILPIQRRLQLLQFARTADCYLVEDDYDSEFRYVGSPISSLQGLSPERVIYIGTLSKILSPALRLGYLVLPAELIEHARRIKRLLDLHSPSLEQLVLAHFIASGNLERHIVRMKRVYQKRRNVLITQLRQHFSDQVEIVGDATGLHLVARFPEVAFTPEIMAALERASVRVYPVERHAIVKNRHLHEIILGYSHLSPAQIEQGIGQIKRTIDLFPVIE
ncbi:MocR-like pyridoxine biosynthesis transcription factor PdxR, partial [Dictyobacter arantiisoli]|uniref:MocR-like pyridoxine biosynthesis transcription factor PdxR n=1 Tax=Dictyobacter arantiisoli TaxID=2014874 RepID=UPI0011EFB310